LRVLAVARPPEFGDEVETEAVIENSRRHYQQLLQSLQATTSKRKNVAIRFEVAVGHPAEQIIRWWWSVIAAGCFVIAG
jgi:hypothetical protein